MGNFMELNDTTIIRWLTFAWDNMPIKDKHFYAAFHGVSMRQIREVGGLHELKILQAPRKRKYRYW
jgi:hypothetical protein